MPIADKYRPHYVYDDYCQWDGHWELIEGMPYAISPAPVPSHQRASLLMSMQFEKALAGCGQCKVYPPLDWKIQEDTVVQPDMMIVCKPIENKFLDFAPVLIIEILSPSTASKDRGEKMELYQQNGVKYYLIADPQFKKLEIYELIKNQYEPVAVNPRNFTFHLKDDCATEVPLSEIWD